MPEHIHLLTNEPVTTPLATFVQIFKQLSSRQLKSPNQKQLWQLRYYDFNVFTTNKYLEKVRYIHRNPVTRGLVSKPEDYRWSSFNHYATGETRPYRDRIPLDLDPPRTAKSPHLQPKPANVEQALSQPQKLGVPHP